MGIISSLLSRYINRQQTVGSLLTIMPEIASNEIRAGRLPQINTNTILLSKDEFCRFVDRAALLQDKEVTRYEGRSSGFSIRLVKGLTYRVGSSRGIPIKEKVVNQITGILYITDRRLLFVAKENGFERKLIDISALMLQPNGVDIQCGNKTFQMIMPQPDLAVETIRILRG